MPLPEGHEELNQQDPERYARLSEPFDSISDADAATKAFFQELGVLREKYKIPDVLVSAIVTAYDKGVPEQRMMTMQYGNTALRPYIILSLYRNEHPMLQALMEGMTG